MKPLFIALALAGLVASGSAAAGYVTPTAPAGLVNSPAGWTFGGPGSVPATFSGGVATANSTANIGGQTINLATRYRIAQSAGNVITAGMRVASPAGFITSAVLSWALAQGFQYVSNQWQVQTNNYPNAGQGYWAWPGGATGLCYRSAPTTDGPLCSAMAMSPNYAWGNCVVNVNAAGTGANGNCQAPGNQWWYGTANYIVVCVAPQVWVNGGCINPSTPGLPTDSDWGKLAASPMGDDVPNSLVPTVPLPVQTPTIDPVQAPVPLGPARVDPVTGKTVQPQAVITPSPTSTDPLRVEVKLINQEIDPVSGQPVTDPTTGQPVKPEEEKDPCKEQPDRMGCVQTGEAEDVDLENQDIGQPITPVSVGGGGTCPASRSFSAGGRSFTISYQPICDFASMIRPVVIALAWLSAGFLLMGATRNEG